VRRPLLPNVLGIFVKAPAPGRVKTRLAAEIGVRHAAEIYRDLGRRVVAACAVSSYDTVVWFTPAEARSAVQAWLKGLRVAAFQAQITGALGTRLAAAFQRHFGEGARRVIVIGSDCPGVNAGLVSRALAALETHDVVLGPAHDGGYYLIGLRAPAGQLFRRIDWSTPAVLGQTVARARQLGLSTLLLPSLRDVDTASDARAVGMLPVGMATHVQQELARWWREPTQA
jgi:uncharacterized protein